MATKDIRLHLLRFLSFAGDLTLAGDGSAGIGCEVGSTTSSYYEGETETAQ